MIKGPTLLLNCPKCQKNIRRMADKAVRHNLAFKPHFKTHQSAVVGKWFREAGVTSITVSSVSMARYFAENGWDDITIAFPASVREKMEIKHLAEAIDLSLFVNDPGVGKELDEVLTAPVEVYIEIDTGSGRTGFLPRQTDEIERIVTLLESSQNLSFKGFYSHPGHSYAARSLVEIRAVHQEILDKMQGLKSAFTTGKQDTPICCIGDTPCCSVGEQFAGVDEISPGNFVFYDLMQVQIGSCHMEDIAVALAAPVAALHPERREAIVHGGAIHFSKEHLNWDGEKIYGLPVVLSEDLTWSKPVENSYLKNLSQEHGVVKCSEKFFRSLKIGDLIGILPVHSCLTANLMGGYHIVE